MMTPEQIAAANAKHMQSIYGSPGMAPSAVIKKPDVDPYAGTGLEGTGGVKGQLASYISDLGYEPEFVPPQDSTGTLGINPDTGDTFLPNEPPPRPQTGNDFDTRPQVYGNPYGIQGGPQMGAGKGGYRPPMYGGGFGGPQYGNPYGGGFGRPQYGNPYGGGFGRPPMGGGKGGGRPPMYGNPYGGGFGGGFGGRMAAPGYTMRFDPSMNLGTGTFGGSFNPYIGGPRSQTPLTGGGDFVLPPGARTLTGGMMGTTNPDGTLSVGAGTMQVSPTGEPLGDMSGANITPQAGSDGLPANNMTGQLLGSGIAGVNLYNQQTGANQPTNPYSTGYGMGYQQQPNQQPNQQPMGGGKGGTQSGGGKGGAQ